MNVLPSAGEIIVAVGAEFPMVMVIGVLTVEAWLESVAVRVMIWVPSRRVATVRGLPDPITPVRFDFQTRDAPVNGPSSASLPIPERVTFAPA